MPEISVIVPVYHVENKIRRCIDSILAQSFTDFELILVDDGSPDKSGEICDEYAKTDARIRVIHQENKGASAARNCGIKDAKGSYLSFVDSDDYVDKDYLKTLFDTINQSDSDIAMCCFYSVSDDGSVTESKHRFSDGYSLDRHGIEAQLYSDIFFNTNTVGYFSLCNKIFRKALVTSHSILIDKSMSFGEDMLFVMKCLEHCDCIAFSDKPLYYYERLSTGLFNRYHRNFIDDTMKCYIALIEQTKPKNIEDEDLLPLSLKYWYYVNRQISAAIQNENYINKAIKKILTHSGVKRLFSVLVQSAEVSIAQYNVQPNELKVPRLVVKNRLGQAVFVARYQFDENFWLRRLRLSIFDKIKGNDSKGHHHR